MTKGSIVLSTYFIETFIVQRWVGAADGARISHWEERHRCTNPDPVKAKSEAEEVLRVLQGQNKEHAWRLVREVTTTVVTEV